MSMYLISHYITPWILPPGLNILLAIIGIFFYWRKPILGKIFVFTAIISLWLASMPIIAYNLIDILQNQFTRLYLNHYEPNKHAAIVILGGGDAIYVEQDNKHTVSDSTFNRIRYAAYLHKNTNLPIIVSGGTDGSKDTEAELMSDTLINDFGIKNVIKEDKSHNTAEESQFLVPIFKKYQFDTIYLVTNAWHMPRSMLNFTKRNNITFIAAPMGYEVYDHRYTILSFLPNIHALDTTAIAFHEFIGICWYYALL